MEEDFKAKVGKVLDGKRTKKNLESVLKADQQRRIEISLIKRGGGGEDVGAQVLAVARRVLRYEEDLNETFLGELKAALPTAEQERQLNVHKSRANEELDNLHPADRFLVECLKIYRLRPRIDGMLYRMRFEENILMLEQDANKVLAGAQSLLAAPNFKALLIMILASGNYMNKSGKRGNAAGFKVTSVNKLIDTKSSNSSDKTWLHFLAKTVRRKSPSTEAFLEELAAPADANRSDLAQVRTVLYELQSQQKALATELETNFNDSDSLSPEDGFAKMFPFAKLAGARLLALKDMVVLADGEYQKALAFYGEDLKSITSTLEFFAIFKTFVVSYVRVRDENLKEEARITKTALAEEKKLANLAAAEAAALAAPEGNLVDLAILKLRGELSTPRTASPIGRRVGKTRVGNYLVRKGEGREGGEVDAVTLLAELTSNAIDIEGTSIGRREARLRASILVLQGLNGVGERIIEEVVEEEKVGAISLLELLKSEKIVAEEVQRVERGEGGEGELGEEKENWGRRRK